MSGDQASAEEASGELTDAQIEAIYWNDREDGWCGHDLAVDALQAIFRRAASVSPITGDLTEAQMDAIYWHDSDDGWCGHDIIGDSLRAIFRRAFSVETDGEKLACAKKASGLRMG